MIANIMWKPKRSSIWESAAFCTFFSKNCKKELTLLGRNGNITKLSPTRWTAARTLKIEQHSLEID